MYATCLFCNHALGANETFETFPVGRRLAFDPAKGRLWVVCKHCERWNLTPLEERWEAIEHAERLYRDTRRRVATDHIGLAKLPDGTDIIRIGEPLRPEFAAWRYGDQFGRRRRRQMLIAGAAATAVGGVLIGGAMAGVTIGAFGGMFGPLSNFITNGNPGTIIARINTDEGQILRVRRRHLAETIVTPGVDGALALDLRFVNGKAHFEGREAARIASIVVPTVNRFGGAQRDVAEAVSAIESRGGAEGFLERLAREGSAATRLVDKHGRPKKKGQVGVTGLYGLSRTQRLALEMALHEDTERRAVEGELEELERAWRDAEEIAAIADDMFLPSSISERISRERAG